MSIDEMTDQQYILVVVALHLKRVCPRAPYQLLAEPREVPIADSLVEAGVFERGHEWDDGTVTYRVKQGEMNNVETR